MTTNEETPTAMTPRQTAADIVEFLQQIGTPITGARTEHEKGLMYGAQQIAKRYGIELPPAPISARETVLFCANRMITGCARTVEPEQAAEQGWTEITPGVGVWLDPQCADAADERRGILGADHA